MIAALLSWLCAPLRTSRPVEPREYVSPLELHKMARKNARRRGRR